MSSPTIGFRNGDIVCKNISFDYTRTPQATQPGIITANGQLLIGSITTYPDIAMKAGEITSTGGSVMITYDEPNINLEVAPAGVIDILVDGAVVVSPVAGQFNFSNAGGNVTVSSTGAGVITFDASPVLDLLIFHLVEANLDASPAAGIINLSSSGGTLIITRPAVDTINFEAAAALAPTDILVGGAVVVSPQGGQFNFSNAGGNVTVSSTGAGVITFDASPVLNTLIFHLVQPNVNASPVAGIINFSSAGGSLAITKTSANTINFETAGIAAGINTLTPNTGGVVTPTANNINVLGLPILAGQAVSLQTSTYNDTSPNLRIKAPNCALFIVDANSLYGTHTTIQSAINAAAIQQVATGITQVVYVRPGTYTENLTMKNQVDLVNFTSDFHSSPVVIRGQMTVAANAACSIKNITLTNNVGVIVNMTAAPVFLTLLSCVIFVNGGDAFNLIAGTSIIMEDCTGQIQTAAHKYFNNVGGAISMTDCFMYNSIASNAQNVVNGGTFNTWSTIFEQSFITSNSVILGHHYSWFRAGGLANPPYTGNANITSQNLIEYCLFESQNNPCAVLGAGNVSLFTECTFSCSGATAVSGAGTIRYTPINFTGLTSTMTVTNQEPGPIGPRVAIGNGLCQIISGSGSPSGTITAPQGSLYLRTDGSATNNRAFINTNGGTGWTALVTVA